MTTMIGAAIAVLAACSDEPEPIIIGEEGTAPQVELARLDSAMVDTLAAVDTLEEVTLVEEQPPARRQPPPAAVAPATPEPEPQREPQPAAEPEPEPAASTERAADSVMAVPPAEPAGPEDTASAASDSAPAEAPRPEPEPAPPVETPAPPASPPADTVVATPDPVPARAADRGGVVPAGTSIHAALDDSLNSRRDTAGQVVTARVMQHVTDAAGKVFIPAGAVVQLTVTQLEPAGSRTAADGKLAMRVDGIRMGNELRKVEVEVQSIPHELKGRGVTGTEAAKVGAGTVVGAVAGRVIGGKKKKKGTVIGAVAGAAAGAAIAAQTADRDVVVKARTPIVLVLKAPLVAIDGR